MEIVRGPAHEIKTTITVSGSGNNNGTTTTHIAIMKVNGRTLKVSAYNPPIIDEGDEVVVAGKIKDGLLEGIAYRNITQGVNGCIARTSLMYVFGALSVIIGLVAPILFISGSPWNFKLFIPIAVGSMFILFGTFLSFKALQIKKAKKLVES